MQLLILCLAPLLALAGPKHKRDGSNLPKKQREFAQHLSVKKRRIFCGRFNHLQRQLAIKYARGRGKDACSTPDEAVLKVLEETGMSLAIKRKEEE